MSENIISDIPDSGQGDPPEDPKFPTTESLMIISNAIQSCVTGSPPAEMFDLTTLLIASNRCLSFAQAEPGSRIKYLTASLACEAAAKGIRLNRKHFLTTSREFWIDYLEALRGLKLEKG